VRLMSTKRWTSIAGAACVLLSTATPSQAAARGDTAGGDTVIASASDRGAVYSIGGGGPVCTWVLNTRGDSGEVENASVTTVVAGAGNVSDQAAIVVINGVANFVYTVTCPGQASYERFVPVNLDADHLIAELTDVVRSRLQLPVPDINPTAESNGIVNLGLWLAVEPQTIDPITAQAGPAVWITVTPTLTATTYDFGNGDQVTCEGTGIPIRDVHPDLDVIEQSPTCGYTYRQSSPEDDPYQLTITTTWELPYTSSDGTGRIDPLDMNLTIDYDVDEIQTLGTNN
jgi:hypothetical protein